MSRMFICGVAALTLYSLSAVGAYAEESCSEKLLTPNIKIKIEDQHAYAYLNYAMCSTDFEKFQSTIGVDTGASYFAISGFGNFNQGNYSEAQHKICSHLTKEQAASALSYTSESVVPESARTDYVDCVHRQPLTCTFTDRDDPTLLVTHHSDDEGSTYIESVIPSDNVQFWGDNLIKKGRVLPRGDTRAPTKILHRARPASISINVKRNGGRLACEAYYPPSVPSPPPPPPLPRPAPSIAEEIGAGKRFIVSFGLLPGGHVGTIRQLADLTGTYTEGKRMWQVEGINATGAYVIASYCPRDCPFFSADPARPRDFRLELWGAPFTFDNQGNVFYSGSYQSGPRVGALTVINGD
jgi:hypothetical protein